MNCFRHPDAVAAAFCKGCSKPLCLACYEQTFGNQRHVCSEECARLASQQPDPEEQPESLFDKIFAKVFITVLVVVIGGIVGGFYFGFAGAMAIDRIQHPPRMLGYSWSLHSYHDPRSSPFRILYDLGITDWRALFGVGAAMGIACVALYLKAGSKITILVCASVYLVLTLWASWTSM